MSRWIELLLRRAAPYLALAALAIGLAWIWTHGPSAPSPTSATVAVDIVGPQGLAWNGTVSVPQATALSLLQAAASEAGWTVEVQHRQGFGARDCDGAYVVAVGPWRESGVGGWNFYVDSGAGWTWIGESAACHAVVTGERLQWRWVEGGP